MYLYPMHIPHFALPLFLSVGRHLGYFHLLAIVNSAVMNNYVMNIVVQIAV